MAKFEKLPSEEQEAIKEQIKQSQEKYIPQVKAGMDEAVRSVRQIFSMPQVPLAEGKSPVEVLEELVVAVQEASRQSTADSQEANRIARAANKTADKSLGESEKANVLSGKSNDLAETANNRFWWAMVAVGISAFVSVGSLIVSIVSLVIACR